MIYLLIYIAILAVVLPYSLMLVSVNRTDDGEIEECYKNLSTYRVNLLNHRILRKEGKQNRKIDHLISDIPLTTITISKI